MEVLQNCHRFHEHTQNVLGGGEQWPSCLKKKAFMMHCDLDKRSLKINIFKILFWEKGEGVTKKSTLRMLLMMLTILDEPISHQVFHEFKPFWYNIMCVTNMYNQCE